MKYVFLVNSHTTYFTALGTIAKKNLPQKEVRMIYVRNYRNALAKKDVVAADFSDVFSYPFFKNLSRFNKYIKGIDERVNKLVDDDNFLLYIPHLSYRLFQIIYTNKHCVGMNYIQEGALVFDKLLTKKPQPLLFRIYDKLLNMCFGGRLWACHYTWTIPDNKLKGEEPESFALTDNFFKALPYKRNLITWPQFDIKGTEYEINPEYPCFIFESSVEMGVVEYNVYMKYSEELIKEVGKEMNYVKFHPFQSEENKKYLVSLFQKYGKEVKQLSMEIPFETYLSTYKNLTLAGFKSSILIFGEQMGHKVISREDGLLRESSKYSSWRSKL